MTKNNTTEKIKNMTALAVFAALAYVIHFIHIPVGFLNLDFKDVVMAIAGMYFGPVSGLALAVLVPLLEYPTSSTAEYGLIMNILSSVSFVVVASLIYRFKKTLSGAIIGLVSAVLAMTSVMMVANLFITPFYMGVSRSEVAGLIPTMLLPFNAIKAILNASLTLCLYKPLTRVLKATGFGKKNSQTVDTDVKPSPLRSALVWIIGGGVATVSFVIIFTLLGGTIAFN